MKDIIYNSQFQNLHMDRAKLDSMKTINITINSNLASSATPYLLYTYNHGYGYVPQFWGLWDITYGGGLAPNVRRGYGYITHNTGAGLTASFFYTVDATSIKLYFHFQTAISPKPSTVGTVAKFTGYLFANDRTDQDYTT